MSLGVKWIPTAALPVDLLAQAARQGSSETRSDKTARSFSVPAWARALVAMAAAWGACAAAFSVEPSAFGSVARWLPLVVGAGVVGLAIARRRAPSLRPERGQGLVIGPTSLVLVDASEVAVLPAERLAVSVDHIELDGVVIDSAFHDPEWRKRLDAAVVAGRSAESRAKDRWRAAADAAPDATREPWAKRHATTLAAVGAGVCFALFLEAGPLHARSASALASRRAEWARAAALDDATTSALGARLDATTAWAGEMKTRRREEERRTAEAAAKKKADAERVAAEKRKGDLARIDEMAKANASVDAVLALQRLLPQDDDVLQLRVLELVRARCRAQYPDAPAGTTRQRVQRLFLRVMCVTDTSVVTYDTTEDTDDEDAETVATALAEDLQALSTSLGRTVSARAKSVVGEPMIEIDVKRVGKPHPGDDNPRRMDQDCTVTVKLLDEALKDPFATRQYVTNGVLGTERR